jgi:hypothetical protein
MSVDLRASVVPKSDQLNYEDVQSTVITAVVTAVTSGSKEQPVNVHLAGYDGRPYKPSKTMRRLIIAGWGDRADDWIGKTICIKGDPSIRFGGVAIGGIRVVALSDIDSPFSLMLATSRGKRSEYRIDKLEVKKLAEKPKRSSGDILKAFTEWASKEENPDQIFQKLQAAKKSMNAEDSTIADDVAKIRIDELNNKTGE